MSSLNFIGGEKGGVGKSVVARLLAQYFIDHGWPFVGYDSDRSHPSFARFYADYASPVVVDSFEGLDRVVASYEAGDGGHALPGEGLHDGAGEPPAPAAPPRVVVDLAAQTAAPLHRWMQESELLEVMGGIGVAVNYWFVSDGGTDSVHLLGSVAEAFGKGGRLIVVENRGRGSDFSALEDAPELRSARDAGARLVVIGALQDATMARIDRHSSSFWAAVNHRDGPHGLGLLERQRAKAWLRNCYAAFDTLEL